MEDDHVGIDLGEQIDLRPSLTEGVVEPSMRLALWEAPELDRSHHDPLLLREGSECGGQGGLADVQDARQHDRFAARLHAHPSRSSA